MAGNVVIVGGGASGLCAAISAARNGADVAVLERGKQPGRKLLKTGNGRCNLTNTHVEPCAYNHPEFVAPVLERFGYAEMHGFFESIGLMLALEDDGRAFPYSREASSVLDCLLMECKRLGVKIACGYDVVDVRPRLGDESPNPPFALLSQSGGWVSADNVVLAAGSDFSLVPFLGHNKIKPSPVLCPLATSTEYIRGLSGTRVRCKATLFDDLSKVVCAESGELLFRDYGISGIMAFDLSRFARPGHVISLDFFPDLSSEEVRSMLTSRKSALAWRKAEDFLTGTLPSKLALAVIKRSMAEEQPLSLLLKDFRLSVRGVGDAKQAQVTRGGVDVDEVDPQTMTSLKAGGLYLAGEALDIDGRCGGYNLHWAFASGIVAGISASA